ncbi:hypothetical protein C2G38_2172813 [Gigaspora rosea]|uniref:CCHC-type domain-containing protein n=1 Tax=Gigaspora rosea TaxID=44941 RepID=A0A397VPH8_9GLOM|nr:hypothetical protein C2G38_2172813 [Gigaspora rosea]
MNRLLLWLYSEAPEFVPAQAPFLPPKPQLKRILLQILMTLMKLLKYCSNCGRIGHNSHSCSRKKNKKKHKKKGKINNAHIDSDSDISTNESESNSDSSSETEAEINKKSKTRKSCKIKDAEAPPLALVPISKKEKQSLKFPSQDEQAHLEKIIEKIIEKMLNEKFGTITTPLHPQNSNSKTLADSKNDEFIDNPMEIDFVQRKEPATDVVTTKYKIKRLNIAKRLKLEVDTKEKHDLRGIATTPTESLGIYPKPMLILPNTLLDKYNYDLLASK